MSEEIKLCAVDGCFNPSKIKARNKYCCMHISRLWRTGKLTSSIKRIEDRLSDNSDINKESGCWEWNKHRNKAGYGTMRLGGKTKTAHRVSFSIHVGEIPDNLMVLHSCDNPCCINPDHLWLGTAQDNHNDAISKGRKHQTFKKGVVNHARI